jgi:hypothetical protein
MKVLVVTSEPIAGGELRAAIGTEEAKQAEVMVVAPALHKSALRFWLSDADEAIARAEQVERKSVSNLRGEGVTAAGDIGESDVLEAIGDALTTFPADRILLCARPEDGETRYREDLDPDLVRERFPVPVERCVL